MPTDPSATPRPLDYATPTPTSRRAGLNAGVHACLFTLVALLNVAVLVIYGPRMLAEGAAGVLIALFLIGFAFVMLVHLVRAWRYVGMLNRLGRERVQGR